jgi:hypothetical protein
MSEPLKSLLEDISERFETFVAVAAELRVEDCYLSASSHGYKLENCFPFLFSPLATNLELKKCESASKIIAKVSHFRMLALVPQKIFPSLCLL